MSFAIIPAAPRGNYLPSFSFIFTFLCPVSFLLPGNGEKQGYIVFVTIRYLAVSMKANSDPFLTFYVLFPP